MSLTEAHSAATRPVQLLFASRSGESGAFLSAALPRTWQCQTCSLAELTKQLGTEMGLATDIILVERPGPSAFFIAKQLAESKETAQLVLLLEPRELVSFQWAVALNPGLGNPLVIDADASVAQIAAALSEANEAFRHQAAMRSAVENINLGVKTRNAAALANARRHRASDRYLANLLAQIPDPIVSTDLGGTVVSWNDAAAAMFRLSIDAALGREFDGFFSADTRFPLRALLEQAATQREASHDELTLRVGGMERHFDALFARTWTPPGSPKASSSSCATSRIYESRRPNSKRKRASLSDRTQISNSSLTSRPTISRSHYAP